MTKAIIDKKIPKISEIDRIAFNQEKTGCATWYTLLIWKEDITWQEEPIAIRIHEEDFKKIYEIAIAIYKERTIEPHETLLNF